MVASFRQPTRIGTVKRSTANYELDVPYFDTPNWGQFIEGDLDTIDALLFAFAGIANVQGVWTNSTAYTVGMRLVDSESGFIYECKVSHTSASSGTFDDERTAHPTYWLIMQTGWAFRGPWAGATDYLEGDVVYNTAEHVVGVAVNAHTSTTDIRTDAAHWNFIVDLKSTVLAAQAAQAAAETAETNAETAEANASAHATTATTQAGIATTEATNAATSASNALTSENNAAAHKTAAQDAQTASENALAATKDARDAALVAVDEFDDLYLGPKSVDPTTDNDGDPLQDGVLYWNTAAKLFRVYDASTTSWYDAPAITVTAESIGYDNSLTGLTADNIQDAVDEIASLAVTDGDKGDITVTAGVWELEAAAVLSKLLTVDGAASALDADLVDGQHGSYYLSRANHTGTQTASSISDFTNAAQLAAIGLTGTFLQEWSSDLDDYASVSPSAFTLSLFSGSSDFAWLTALGVSTFGQTLIGESSATNALSTLGLSSYGKSLVTAANYAAMRALLDLEAGTDFLSPAAIAAAYQPLDSDLTALAALASSGMVARTGSGTVAARTVTGTANEVSVTNGDGVAGNPTLSLATAAKATGRQEIWIDAGAMKSYGTNGAGTGNYDSGSNDVLIDTKDFDQTTSESVGFSMGMPNGWDEGTVTFIPYWTADSGTAAQTCIFTLAAVAISNDDVMNAAVGTAQSSSDALITTGDLHIGPESAAITIAGTPAANDLVYFKLSRDVSDTLAADARLIGIKLVLNFASANDA